MAEEIREGAYLYLQRKGDDTGVSTKTWGIMVTSMPMLTNVEAKEPEVNDWKDEDGEDVLDNVGVKLKAFDFEVGLVYLGSMQSYAENYQAMVRYLTSRRKFSIYSTHTKFGRHDCYLQSMSDATHSETGRQDKPYCFQWTMKARCADPTSEVHCDEQPNQVILY